MLYFIAKIFAFWFIIAATFAIVGGMITVGIIIFKLIVEIFKD